MKHPVSQQGSLTCRDLIPEVQYGFEEERRSVSSVVVAHDTDAWEADRQAFMSDSTSRHLPRLGSDASLSGRLPLVRQVQVRSGRIVLGMT